MVSGDGCALTLSGRPKSQPADTVVTLSATRHAIRPARLENGWSAMGAPPPFPGLSLLLHGPCHMCGPRRFPMWHVNLKTLCGYGLLASEFDSSIRSIEFRILSYMYVYPDQCGFVFMPPVFFLFILLICTIVTSKSLKRDFVVI